MRNRTLPLGYGIENGEIVIDEQEAQTVKSIFDDYCNGSSLKTLVNALNERNVMFKERYRTEIVNINQKIIALRGELERVKAVIAASEKVNVEIERLKKLFENMGDTFNLTDEMILRRMVEYIRVMSEGTIIVVFKGGMTVEEKL